MNQCYVDLDEAIVESPEDQPSFPNYRELIYQFETFGEAYMREVIISSVLTRYHRMPDLSPCLLLVISTSYFYHSSWTIASAPSNGDMA